MLPLIVLTRRSLLKWLSTVPVKQSEDGEGYFPTLISWAYLVENGLFNQTCMLAVSTSCWSNK